VDHLPQPQGSGKAAGAEASTLLRMRGKEEGKRGKAKGEGAEPREKTPNGPPEPA